MKRLLALTSAVLIFAACNENETEDPVVSPMNTSIDEVDITANDSIEFKTFIDGGSTKLWTATAFTLAGLTTFTSCRLDDEMVFNANGTYTYNGGANLCGAEDNQQMKSGTWELDYSNTGLIFDRGSSNEEFALIIGLTENEIRLDGSYMSMEVRGIYTASE